MLNKFFYVVKKIISYMLKEVLVKYLLCYLSAILIYLIYTHYQNSNSSSILLSVVATLLSMPLVFVVYDAYLMLLTAKPKKIVCKISSEKINDIFLRFIYFSMFFRQSFDQGKELNLDNINSWYCINKRDLFKNISDNEHSGFFIFSVFDNYDDDIESLLNSNLIIKYLDTKEISILCEFIENIEFSNQNSKWLAAMIL